MSSGREDRPASGPGEPEAVFLASEEEAGRARRLPHLQLCAPGWRGERCWDAGLAQDSSYLSLTRGARRKELE